jgi:hypothetical protein
MRTALSSAVVFAAAFVISAMLVQPARANHSSGAIHIGSMHEAAAVEAWCAQPETYGSSNWGTAVNNIIGALYASGSWDYRVWDPVYSGYKIDFAYGGDRCDLLANRSAMWIEYHLWSDNSGNCGSTTASCVWHFNRYNGPYGHLETGLAQVNLYGPYTTGEQLPGYYMHQVNHESGHVLGLADGTASCPPSIMHYPCPDYSLPTSGDLGTVDAIALNQIQ